VKYLENNLKVNFEYSGKFRVYSKQKMELDNKLIEEVKIKIIESEALNRQISNTSTLTL
jgi:hypothetical protein